jgi:regulator of protease activity HflC (stomatin/prohibitin superfamily)
LRTIGVWLADITSQSRRWLGGRQPLQDVRLITAVAGAAGLALIQVSTLIPAVPALVDAGIGVVACLAAAGLAATAVRYLAEIDPARLPEGPALSRGGRVVGWILVLAAVSIVLQWAGLQDFLWVLELAIGVVNGALCYSLMAPALYADRTRDGVPADFSADFGVTRLLGSRTNILRSILDTGQRQFGIDLRSTWALTVVRRSLEPLVFALVVVGWLSTGLTVVAVEEQGLVERLGRPVPGDPLSPGMHLHLPWPFDTVSRLPVRRVQSLTVGHEGPEASGPEDVLWARVHAANEYTLLLGNGRDLITVDAAVQYRIVDPRAWRYHSQNPGQALRAIAHRAVMRTTVNKTLADALSENLVSTTARMRTMVQEDAEALGLGVEVLGFTVGGMHPPVMVAADYQSVVSAALGKVTAVVNAQAFRNRTVPYAQSDARRRTNTAQAEGVDARARATGEAWSFLALQAQYGASPREYFFRRRLEALEGVLESRRFTVVDARVQRDGGELWITP